MSTPDMTVAELDDLERLDCAATPPEWTRDSWLAILRTVIEADAKDNVRLVALLLDWPTPQVLADASLIAAARNALPRLLAAARKGIAHECELAKWRAIYTRVVPGMSGGGVEVPATPESTTALLDELQSEWDAAEHRLAAAERERDDLRIREREVTCVWCGHQFKSTLQSQAQHLYEHAKVCEKHPIHAAESQLAALRAEVERLRAGIAEIRSYCPCVYEYPNQCANCDRCDALIAKEPDHAD